MNSASHPASSSASLASGPLEKTHLRLGFVALADAAPLVAAKLLEFGHAHGLTLELSRQPSWAAVRDKLISGDLDAAHTLYGLVYGVQLGLGGPQTDMAVLMVLNRNGQAVTLSNRLADALAEHGTLRQALAALGRKPVFAQTFPTGTHAMWLYYWLAAQGVHPLREIESVVIPPPQMVAALAEDRLDGLCVGEPWNAMAEAKGVGRTVAYTSEVWPDHPEKVLACRRDFVSAHPNTARALVQTMLEACRWLDGAGHRNEIARWLARPEYIGIDEALIAARFGDAIPATVPHGLPVRFFGDGAVNYPWPFEGAWFLTQFERWGMIDARGDYAQIAGQINQTRLYHEAAAHVKVAVPAEEPAQTFMDGTRWPSATSVADFAQYFSIRK
ncbi:CmpA/NrtA family ABC transporter substrate-binding protein [Paraburkholderia phenoliruptrix]|uniref:Sulfonate/nitrate/taurine transport system substrate-binding protein n=2 Tax=Paraburkholderia phenoliruptrix TaxID=252970 RepID=K0DX42_9BURK|nr:CmpA/NrtA family ABC transporter substrate-binding protein [Paraburkholderia phenoliruptrix]AFT87889.1 sulfonate/nitrate/taurine transport system substrate-binding protein [Paraburkholderia phenoliruptrix BR3459a]MDR6418125.1 nitrate/nitrite transport system substrate-binding protein [Paraburkholderia phenoliruptrix]CAB4046794.1 Nitrate/nitrite binding protein NrtA [Paraburkholderia phenoliruptrix]